MAKGINKVELLGRVGADPEMKYTQGGTAVTQLRLHRPGAQGRRGTPRTGTRSSSGTAWPRR